MPKAFWAGWAAAIVLALVLPIAIPALLPNANQFGSLGTECRHDAEQLARQAGSSFPSFWPLSTSVHACSQDEAGDVAYVVTVKRVGPYGISFAEAYLSHGRTYTSHEREVSWSTSYSGPLIALAVGIAFISLPFVVALIWAHGREISNLIPAAFWWGWASVVAFAVVLPIAVPYAIWPPGDASGCELHTRVPVTSGTVFALVTVPMEITGERCIGDTTDPIAGKVIVHGAYGIPMASATIYDGGYDSLNPDDGVFLGMVALAAGVFAVSLPFLTVLAHARIRRLRTAPT